MPCVTGQEVAAAEKAEVQKQSERIMSRVAEFVFNTPSGVFFFILIKLAQQ